MKKFVELGKINRKAALFQKFARQMVSEGAVIAMDFDLPPSKTKALNSMALKWTRKTRQVMTHG